MRYLFRRRELWLARDPGAFETQRSSRVDLPPLVPWRPGAVGTASSPPVRFQQVRRPSPRRVKTPIALKMFCSIRTFLEPSFHLHPDVRLVKTDGNNRIIHNLTPSPLRNARGVLHTIGWPGRDYT